MYVNSLGKVRNFDLISMKNNITTLKAVKIVEYVKISGILGEF